jgi:hypothetical protein
MPPKGRHTLVVLVVGAAVVVAGAVVVGATVDAGAVDGDGATEVDGSGLLVEVEPAAPGIVVPPVVRVVSAAPPSHASNSAAMARPARNRRICEVSLRSPECWKGISALGEWLVKASNG